MSLPPLVGADEALRRIADAFAPRAPVEVTLAEASGRILAEEIVPLHPVPPFDNAAMDGYAVRAADLPGDLHVVARTAAGAAPAPDLGPGNAVRVMTGAPIPRGADAVVQQEWVETLSDARVRAGRGVEAGHNIRRAGGDLAPGVPALRAGVVLRAQEIGLLASIGRDHVRVAPLLDAALLLTGNELAATGAALGPGMIRDSNGPMLAALLAREGCTVRRLGVVRDDHAETGARIAEGLRGDLLVTAGGVSVGDHDLVGDAFRAAGVEILAWRLNIRPGMPLLIGRRGATAVFGLPGNPVSAMVTFTQFVRAAIRRMTGATDGPLRARVILEEEIVKQDGKRHFVRGILAERDGRTVVRPSGSQVSNVLSSLTRANCLIILPEEGRLFRAGERVEVEFL